MKKNLSPAKKALLDKWLQGKKSPLNNDIGIPKRPIDQKIKLTYSQQRQLFLELLDRDTAVNNLSVFLQLLGNLDEKALTQSANQIIARHEILRTSFAFDVGLPTAEIAQEISFSISIHDLQSFKGKAGEIEALRLGEKEVLKPFDLRQAPLFRIDLYKLDNEKYFLLFVAHHTVADGWSLGVFLQELMVFYENNVMGRTTQLSALPIQYFDYAHWQSDDEQHEKLKGSLSYWKEQLKGDLPVLELPTYKHRSARQTFNGGTHRFELSKDLTHKLEMLSRQEDVTMYMTLLTTFYIVLYRYSQQNEILIGSPVANRHVPEIENLIGVFINVVVLRLNLEGNPDFRSLLQQVKKISTDAHSHQNFPFEKLVEELKPKRDLSRSPLFQVLFNMQNSPMPELEIQGLETTFWDINRGVSQFDLTLMMAKLNGQYQATVEYNLDLFNQTTISRIFNSYMLVLEAELAQPHLPISKLKYAPQEEMDVLLYDFNQTQLDIPNEKCMHMLFEEQAEKTPAAIAVIYNHEKLNYLQLNKRANNLAKHLEKLGVDVGIRVGVLMERSVNIVEALLSVHKLGAVYIPIDTSLPTERIQFILQDAEIQVLLTNIDTDSWADDTVEVVQVSKLDLSEDNHRPTLPLKVNTDQLAYIIYTSGSSGKPKGVMVNHSSLVNLLCSMRKSPGINSDDLLLAVTSISFDIAALELFLPLITGATTVIASEEMTTNTLLMGEAILLYEITIMQATPATWQLLVNTGWAGKPDLKVLCGGEALTRKLADKLLDRTGALWNMYGPTETTIWSSISQIQKGNDAITIGKPIGNTQLYILDRNAEPLPVGIEGELYIGGSGLADGYLNSSELTQEKFVQHTIHTSPATRLYKTGDNARFLTEVSIEVLGRKDDQLKLNGHRIELGEIRSAFIEHPFVNDAIVIARTHSYSNTQLIAYFVCSDGLSIDVSELKDFIKMKLPPYMIPVFLISIDKLPLTSNGKINRKALPIPENLSKRSGYVAPRNEIEEILVEIWQNALNIEQVGINDNFFDLGGASIQSIQVVAKANMYGYQISVENIFELQTIGELATLIKEEFGHTEN